MRKLRTSLHFVTFGAVIFFAQPLCAESLGKGHEATEQTSAPFFSSQSLKVDAPVDAPKEKHKDNNFFLVIHKPNYLLPVAHNFSPNEEVSDIENLDNTEVKFQFSMKVRLSENAIKLVSDEINERIAIWFAYSNLSLWQAYNGGESAPFRETNHEPEIFVDYLGSFRFLGFDNNLIRLGAVHQSNGRGGEFSRSWNRIYTEIGFKRGDFEFKIKPWYRIPETDDDANGERDDNSDIHKYLGYGEIYTSYKPGCQEYSVMWRNNLQSENRNGVQFDYIPFACSNASIYVQYYYGYGESLIDYNHSVNRLSAGFRL